MKVTLIMAEIERSLADGGNWCKLEKAHTLASLVLGLRPLCIVEIGVWMGGSLIPMAIAQRDLVEHVLSTSADPSRESVRKIFAIDPWDADASIAGEVEKNAEWWKSIDHEKAYQAFLGRVKHHGINRRYDMLETLRERSDDVNIEAMILRWHPIDLLHIDGNHTDQAVRDAERYLPHVALGGIAILDDVNWEGGNVSRAVDVARNLGFVKRYELGTGFVMQRISPSTMWDPSGRSLKP